MQFKSYLNEVLRQLKGAEKDCCEEIGTYVEGQAKNRATVLTGNMKRSITHEVIDGNKGVYVGTTMEAPYAPIVEKGSSNQSAQPFLEPAIMESTDKIEKIVRKHFKLRMGGK